MSDDTLATIKDAVLEIRSLIRLMAEPAIAERDKKLRSELKRLVGTSGAKSKSAQLMDGTRTQGMIRRETGVNQGNLSTFVGQLRDVGLIDGDAEQPKLTIPIPANFFEDGTNNE
jgi:hypothetical protein